MGPVRIKYYGVLWLTRPTYLVIQSIVLIVCAGCMAVGSLGVLSEGSVLPQGNDLGLDLLVLLFWVGLLAFPLESIETVVVLRKFARAEAERQTEVAGLDAGEPAPSARHSTAVRLPPDERSDTDIQP